jgi:TetR/AcrR family transcriptional repressor of nem operon
MTYIISHMRYAPEHKEETRARIVGAASRSFRRRGSEGIAIADLMKELELTHGGFYRHFGSKEELFAEALVRSLDEMGDKLAAAADGNNRQLGLKKIIEAYLSPWHCANTADGCPVAVLATEVPRHSRKVRRAYEEALGRYAERLAAYMPGRTASERRSNFLLLFGGMAGTLALARSLEDAAARAELLRSARELYLHAFSGA